MARCFIGLGSNLDDPLRQLQRALAALAQLPRSRLQAVSRAYPNPAIGPGAQPDYLNAVAALDTELEPLELLHALQAIETRQGRVRGERWAARSLDLDLLLFADLQWHDPELQIPHPRIAERAFVLWPLADIAADLQFPDGRRLSELLMACPATGLGAPIPLATGARP